MDVWIRRDDPRWGPPPDDLAWDDDPEEPAPAGVALAERFAALGRFAGTVAPFLGADDAPALGAARALADRAGARLGLGYTVVAFAGATGVGKSSLFNAVAGMPLSPPGHLRPTTGEPHACIWEVGGRHVGSDPLLDWLGVARGRRFLRESILDADREAPLRGLVLLDLPDVDSIAAGNRLTAERLVGMVDRVVWVLDPQKYADRSVHEQYLRQLGALRDVTVVVFNQTDRLGPDDAEQCRRHLAQLVAADGLPEVPVIGASSVTGEGIARLRAMLEAAVQDRRAAVTRLEAELAEAVTRLAPLVPVPGPGEDHVSHTAVPELAEALARASAVPTLAAEAAATYRDRSVVWRAPWRRVRFPDVPPADPTALAGAVRRLAQRVGPLLPEPWPRHLREAPGAALPGLPDELARQLSRARGPSPVPRLWLALRAVWWLSVGATAVAFGFGRPLLGAWMLGLAVVLPAVAAGTGAWRAARYRRALERRLRLAAVTVARELVAPVRAVLRAYDQAHTELTVAGAGATPERIPGVPAGRMAA